MSPEPKHSVLIVEDDLDVADMLNAYFRVQGYNVTTVNWGEDAVKECQVNVPDLVILDIRLPDIDGFEVAHRLRTNRRTEHIPIIFLTEKRSRTDRLKGLELGADDYITKPFDVQELRLRVRNALKRVAQDVLTNPITGLPEGRLVDERILQAVKSEQPFALMLISLENLDAFREVYGFVASDDVLRAVSLMLQNTLKDLGNSDFLGHIEKHQFILVTEPALMADLHDRIRSRLVQSLDYFYPLKAREANHFPADRLRIRTSQAVPARLDPASTAPEKIRSILQTQLS